VVATLSLDNVQDIAYSVVDKISLQGSWPVVVVKKLLARLQSVDRQEFTIQMVMIIPILVCMLVMDVVLEEQVVKTLP
jgi:hypothetical protein